MEWLGRSVLTLCFVIGVAELPNGAVFGQPTRCVGVEIYLHGDEPEERATERSLRDLLTDRRGVTVTVRDLDGADADRCRERLRLVAQHFQFDATSTPVIYGCNRVIVGPQQTDERTSKLEAMLRIDVFVRSGCPRCARAKPFLRDLAETYPGIGLRVRDIVNDEGARSELEGLVRRHQQAATSVPVFHVCDQLIVGFDHETTTGQRIERILANWTYPCHLSPTESADEGSRPSPSPGARPWEPVGGGFSGMLNTAAAMCLGYVGNEHEDSNTPPPEDIPPLPIPGVKDAPPSSTNPGLPLPGDSLQTADVIDLPLFGRLSASRLGLPLFTIAVGLVDGFNPCAMWVLLFLLSILVNLQDRWRILAVAGVFVLISGLAYFAFMAAWLNIFRWVGLLRPVQITLALTAIAVGSIHVKDFFAFKRGVSLSIPESAKPGIYARVRRIVTAENLLGAVTGASVLAVMVNIVELLCTAGLPALYTEILTMQQLPTWQNYGYLVLYNAAYMFDDGLMVAVVVVTLGRRKMQERHGRVLKLISGSAIAALGIVMLLKPEWLV